MKACPSCKTSIIHFRGHGDHIIFCKNCLISFCYLCGFIFKEKGSRSSSRSSSNSSSRSSTNSTRSLSSIFPKLSDSSVYSTVYSTIYSFNTNFLLIKSQIKHYRYSNCKETCNALCGCKSYPFCLILYKEHCKECNNNEHCEQYNSSLDLIKSKIILYEENPNNLNNLNNIIVNILATNISTII